MTPPPGADSFRFMTADIAGKTHETLLFLFFAGHANLVRVNDNNEIAGVDVGSKNRFFFSAQEVCGFDRDATENLIFGVDQPPFAVDFIGFGRKGLHYRLKKGTETTGRQADCQPTEW